MSKQKIVIVGGGFAGVKAALLLCDSKLFDVTLVSDHADFRYYPVLYHTAAGGKKVLSSIPIAKIFADKNLNFVQDTVTNLDRATKTITTASKRTVEYDTLLLNLGVQTNYFGITGLKEFSFGIKSNREAERLKKHLHQQLLEDNRVDINYVVVGGGPTGVELSGAMATYLKQICKNHQLKHAKIHVDLVEASDRLVPRMPKEMSRSILARLKRLGVRVYLNAGVKAETADALMINNKRLFSHTVVWTAGVTNHPFFAEQNFQETKTGKVRVNQFLEAEPNILVLGDNADTPYSGMAQTAIVDGTFVAKNLIRQAKGKQPKPYKAKKPIYVIPVGTYWSAVLWGNVEIYGLLGWTLRRLADLVGYHDYQPWSAASRLWLHEDEKEELCPVCGEF